MLETSGVYLLQPPKEHFQVRREASESARGCPHPRRTWYRPAPALQVTDIGMATASAATEDTHGQSRLSQDAANPHRPAGRFDSWRPAQPLQGTGDAASGRHCPSGRANGPAEHELGLEARFHATASTKIRLWERDSCCCKVHRTSTSTSRSSGTSRQAPARHCSVPRRR